MELLEIAQTNGKILNHESQLTNFEIVNYSDISYEDFFHNYLIQNRPCLIKNVSTTWNCTHKWVIGDTINCEYLKHEYGDLLAPVAKCSNDPNCQDKDEMKLSDFIDYFVSQRDNLLYLKDWHLKLKQPNDSFYDVPKFFCSDWLNEYCLDNNLDDYMFVYIGPENSWTPLHADVYSSYSWSVNVIGKKKWLVFPPKEEEKLKNKFGHLPAMFNPEDAEHVNHQVTYYEVVQEKGDAIFVPSGWHHQVVNLRDTISINHNWINGCNIKHVYTALQENLVKVQKEIEEFETTPEYGSECQIILKCLFGMDYKYFMEFLCYIANKRLEQIGGEKNIIFDKYIFGLNHLHFDLNAILDIMINIDLTPDFFEKHLLLDLKDTFIQTKLKIESLIPFKQDN